MDQGVGGGPPAGSKPPGTAPKGPNTRELQKSAKREYDRVRQAESRARKRQALGPNPELQPDQQQGEVVAALAALQQQPEVQEDNFQVLNSIAECSSPYM